MTKTSILKCKFQAKENTSFEIGLTKDPHTTGYLPDSERDMRNRLPDGSNDDVFGCGYRQKQGVIFWTVNGLIVNSSRENIRGKLYPMFSGLGGYVIKGMSLANFAGPMHDHIRN